MNKWKGIIYFNVLILFSIFYTSSVVSIKGMLIFMASIMIMTLIYAAICFLNEDIWKLLKNKKEKCFSKRLLEDNDNKEFIWIIVTMISYVIAGIISRGLGFRELYSVIIILIGICYVGNKISKYDLREILSSILLCFVVVSFIAGVFGLYCYINNTTVFIGESFYGIADYYTTGKVIISIMVNPNSYALLCAMSIMLSIILFVIKEKKVYKGFLIVNILLQTYNIMLTGSRNSILIIAVFIMSYFIFFFRSKYKKYAIILLVLLGVMGIGALKLGVLPEDSAFINKITNADFTSGRIAIWTAAINIIKSNLLFGVGIKNSNELIAQAMGNPTSELGTHNGYLGVMLANGIIVFLLIMAYIAYVIINSVKERKKLYGKDIEIKSLLICFLIAMLFANIPESLLFGDLNFPLITFWIMLVITKNYKEKNIG